MNNSVSFSFNKITLNLPNPIDWMVVKKMTGKVEHKRDGQFEIALSTQNLQRIGRYFADEHRKPKVVGGQQFLDQIKQKLADYKKWREGVQEVVARERYPVPPNGKFVPYAHQTKIIGTMFKSPYAPIFADCGTGKTGSTARAVEMLLEQKDIRRGKVLVSAPLSILEASWMDDINRFTNLKARLLWAPMPNKTVLGKEKVLLQDLGPKPTNVLTTKNKTGTKLKNKLTGAVQDQVTVLDNPAQWTKYKATWKVAIDSEGVERAYGEVYGRTALSETTRENYIRECLADPTVDLYLINHDGVRIYEKILKEFDFEWVIIDESTKIKSPKSQVSQSHVDISWKAKRRNILSGTPNPNGFIDLWQQFYFLDRGLTLEPCLKDFLHEYFKPVIVGYIKTPGGKKEAIKYELRGVEEKERLIQRVRSVGIYLEQRDCIDLPPRTDMKRIVYMSPEQEAAYDRMAIDLVTELKCSATGDSLKIDASNTLSKIMRLRQITSGFLMDKEGNVLALKHNPKLEDLDQFIEELGGKKVVIAAQFREEIRRIQDRYEDLNAEAIYGDVPVERRGNIVREFQNSDKCKLIVLQPAAAAHGLTLTAASHLVFVSLDYNFEYYYQTAKRIERLGQKNPIFIIHSIARYADDTPTIDDDLIELLAVKGQDRNALFSMDDEVIAQRLTENLIKNVEARHGKL